MNVTITIRPVLASIVMYLLCAVFDGMAATYTWAPGGNGGDGLTWDTGSGNWNSAAATWSSPGANAATFNTAGATVNVSGSVYVYGNSGNGIVATADATINGGEIMNSGDSGWFGISVAGGKKLTLKTAFSNSNPNSVNVGGGGSLEVGSGGLLSGGGQALNVNAGSLIQSGGSVTVGNQDAMLVGQNSTASYTITGGTFDGTATRPGVSGIIVGYQQGATATTGTLTIAGASALVKIHTAAGGGNGGSIYFGWNGAGGTGILNLQQGELQLGQVKTYNGAGYLNLGSATGTATMRPYAGDGLSIYSGLVTFTLTGTNGIISSTDSTGTARTVEIYASIGEDSAGRGVTFAGAGTINLRANSTYSGDTFVAGGILKLMSSGALGGSTLNHSLAGAGTIVFDNSAGTAFSLGGLSGDRDLALTNSVGAAMTLNVGSNNGSTAFQGVLSGNGSLVKAGSGTLALAATNTYSGTTTVSNGVLVVNGELTNSVVTVVSGGTLGGAGKVGTVIVNAGGAISPGGTNTIGTLTATNLAFAEGTQIRWNYDSTTADVINVTGAMALPTNATVNVSGSGTVPGKMLLLRGSSLGGASDLSGWTITGPGIDARTHAVRLGNEVYLVTPRGTVIIIR